ncbi:MAG: hypothetical protein NTZ09_09195 [Candidatus Hydrogenedentes bacterium]|nr:hypothetical protein [Candidatus Hydrogenedentota bacterium]
MPAAGIWGVSFGETALHLEPVRRAVAVGIRRIDYDVFAAREVGLAAVERVTRRKMLADCSVPFFEGGIFC